MARRPPTIPRQHLKDGVVSCLSVVQSRLQEAGVLVEGGYLAQAFVLFSLAVEEFGKAVLLREAYETRGDPVMIEGFYDHDRKLDAAAKHVPERFLLVHTEPVPFSPLLRVGSPIDLNTRLSALYVDWKDGGWRVGTPVDSEFLEENMGMLEAIVLEMKIDWTD